MPLFSTLDLRDFASMGYTREAVLTLVLADMEKTRASIQAVIGKIHQQLGTRQRRAQYKPAEPAKPPAPAKPAKPAEQPKRKMSPAAKARIVEAQRKRWAKYHREQRAAEKAVVAKPRKARRAKAAGEAPPEVMTA